ncbi:hypothetical protein AC579_8191 [Pseudocercospora musae]|uniref:ChrR-like cupin domain-containing protein n=1 Tax=Pseudocercospora musae TaxID=113226 RepID=A0A139IV79_9PEZI|nr:hypothetical protein AC579_8191 [Pseudocercospora musae]
MESRKGCYIIKLKTGLHAELGKHRHRGEGKPGDYITEMPGTIHTLYMGENSEVIFDVTGSIEFFNDDNTLRETMDGFSF